VREKIKEENMVCFKYIKEVMLKISAKSEQLSLLGVKGFNKGWRWTKYFEQVSQRKINNIQEKDPSKNSVFWQKMNEIS
jgi:hypothetical protein